MKKYVLKDKVKLDDTVITKIGKKNQSVGSGGYEAFWGYETSLTYHACYGGLTSFIRDKRKDYVLHTWAAHDPKFLDYEEIVKRWNRMFKNVFTIRLMRTQDPTIYVVRAKEKDGLDMHIVGKIIAYRLLFVMIRGMNNEYRSKRSKVPKKYLPIKQIWQFVYLFNKHLTGSYGGHGINDQLHGLRSNDDILKTACKNYTKTIRDAYGRRFDWTNKKVITYLNKYKEDYLAQTPAFTVIETMIERFS